jgi:sec-independent protein translocase protein TatA
MPSIGGWEWIIILVIVVIIFGVGKMSDIGGALGKSIREFREASTPEDSADTAPGKTAAANEKDSPASNDVPKSEGSA